MAQLPQKLKVLLVDDTRMARALLRQALQTFPIDFTFIEAGDGQEAIEVFNSERPALIFIDLEMPRKNGLQAVADIRKLCPAVGIVACLSG